MQQTIFTSKYFNDRISLFNTDFVGDLANKKQLINRWITALESGNLSFSKETQIDLTFLNDIFGEVLDYGYEIDKQKINLIPKSSIDSKEPDAILGFFTQQDRKDIRAVIELKDSKTDLDRIQNRLEKISPVTQAYEYARKAGENCKWIIVSNIQTIRLYNKESDRYEIFNLIDLKDDFELKRFFFLLHKDRLFFQSGESYVDILYRERLEEEKKIEKEFYFNYHSLRTKLFEHLVANNKAIEPILLLEKTQKILDRIIFVCFCADLNIIPKTILQEVIKTANPSFKFRKDLLWSTLQELFYTLDLGNNLIAKLNGGLFEEDEILNNLKIADSILLDVLKLSEYDYRSDLNVNILGHIFEQSISDIEKMKQELALPKFQTLAKLEETGKRKSFGIFYTPENITKYLVKESIGNWLEEQKQELGENDLPILTDKDYEAINFAKVSNFGKVENEKIEKNKQFWEQYLERLMSIKILDPACGSGAFLVECLNFLITEYRSVQKELRLFNPPIPTEKYKSKLKQELTLNLQKSEFDIEGHILRNNLYGVDINFESVEITKLALWLKTVKRGKILTDIDYNIQQGNSLISDENIAGSLAFDWNKRFGKIMETGGFDIIVGNPPYVSTKIINEIEKNYYIKNYNSAVGQFDLYGLFIEKGIHLLKTKAKLGFITSNTFLSNKDFSNLRKLLFENISINEIINLGETVFPDANVDVSLLIFTKKINENNKIKIVLNNENFVTNIFHFISQNKFNIAKNNYEIKLNSNEDDFELIDKIFQNKTELSEILNLPRGIELGSNSDKIINEYKDDYHKLLVGKDIAKYSIHFENRFIRFENDKSMFKDIEIYEQPKILIQRIRNLSLKTRIIATLDTENYLCTNTLRIGILKNQNFELEYILAVLNSKLINWIFSKYFLNKDIYAYQLERLPIPEISKQQQQILSDLVNKILKTTKEINLQKSKFINRIATTYNINKTNKLIDFNENKFSEIYNEIKKQKISLSLKQQDELEEYFTENKNEILSKVEIQKSIDKQIDTLVYKLYDLTDAEIALVEAK